MLEATWMTFAFVPELGACSIGLPSLVGYLAAGFALAAFATAPGLQPAIA